MVSRGIARKGTDAKRQPAFAICDDTAPKLAARTIDDNKRLSAMMQPKEPK